MGGSESKKLQLVRATYLWKVEKSADNLVPEPIFSAYFDLFGDEYRMGLHKERNFEIKLHQKKESDALKRFRCVSSLLDSFCLHCYTKTNEVEIGGGTSNVVLMDVPQTLVEGQKSGFMLTDRFFYISLKVSRVDSHLKSPDPVTDSGVETLSSDLQKLRFYETHDCDVKIFSNTGDCFKAHRLILSARSPVFEAMFRHNNTKESTEGVVKMTDVDSETLSKLLLYLYSGRVHGLDSNNASSLIKVADKYDLQDLKDSCLEMLLNNLNFDNICDAVVLAETRVLPRLSKKIQEFMSKNVTEVLQSERWQALQEESPHVVNSVLAELVVSGEGE